MHWCMRGERRKPHPLHPRPMTMGFLLPPCMSKEDIKNKQAHLAVLMKKVEELKAEIESLEQQQASAPPSLTKEKIANETRQEAKLDKEKLADLIDLGPAENESPSLDDVLERKLLAFRARGPHKWVPKGKENKRC